MVQVVDAFEDSLLAMVNRWWRDEREHCDVRLFLEDAGDGPGCIAVDGACGRVFGFGGDVGEMQGVTVDRGVVSRYVLQPDRVVGRDLVEVGGIDVTIFGEFALVPAGAEDPFAGFGGCHPGLHAADDLGDAFGVSQLDVVELVDAPVLVVAVGVDEPGSGRSAAEIEDLGVCVGEGHDLLFRADGDDLSGADGEGFGDGVFGVDG